MYSFRNVLSYSETQAADAFVSRIVMPKIKNLFPVLRCSRPSPTGDASRIDFIDFAWLRPYSRSCCLRRVNVFKFPGTAKIISISLPPPTITEFPTGLKFELISSCSVPVPSGFT